MPAQDQFIWFGQSNTKVPALRSAYRTSLAELQPEDMAQHLDVAGDKDKKQLRYGSLFWKFVTYLKDYCANCTLAGFAYIANHR